MLLVFSFLHLLARGTHMTDYSFTESNGKRDLSDSDVYISPKRVKLDKQMV